MTITYHPKYDYEEHFAYLPKKIDGQRIFWSRYYILYAPYVIHKGKRVQAMVITAAEFNYYILADKLGRRLNNVRDERYYREGFF